MKLSVMKPGLLVSLKSTLRGGVLYRRVDIEAEHTTEDGAKVARWETTREIPDPVEFERATVARNAARSRVVGVCCLSSFGLLCPEAEITKLEAAIIAARKIADDYNASAAASRVEVYVLVGRIAQDDAEAIRAVTAELRELMEAMREGIKAADVDAIREAANKARALGGMLSEEAGAKVAAAITEARAAAREIVRRVAKSGELAADVVKLVSVQKIEAARFAFLDLDEAPVTTEAPSPVGLDLAPAPVLLRAAPVQQFSLEV